MAWYSIDMPEESVTDGGYHRFCRQFQKAFIGAGAPPELALFALRNASREGRRLYLSPNSHVYISDLIQCYGAQPCDVPDAGSVTLVYGVPGAKTLLSTTKDESLMVSKHRSTTGDSHMPTPNLEPAPKKRESPTIYPLTRTRQAASSG